jgi:hypothetical protein
MNTGYTKDLTPEEKRKNEIAAIKSILKDYPDNQYWLARLAALLETEPICCCYEYAGDNPYCPVHGGMCDSGEFTDSDYRADYQERSELYAMGIGA